MLASDQIPVDVLHDYVDGPCRLRRAVAGLTEAELNARPPEGGWSIRQIVHHIADGDQLWSGCIRIALGNCPSGFDLRWYWARPQDEWAETWAYSLRAIEPSLALLEANRRHIVQLLEVLPEAPSRSTVIVWSDGGKESVTVTDMVSSQSRHVFGHCEDIQRIRAAHGLLEQANESPTGS